MIRWRDEGIVIDARRHGETAVILQVFTRDHGRVAGVLRGGGGRRMAALRQPGSQVDVHWQARLDEHLGQFTAEPLRSRAAQAMATRLALSGQNALCAMIQMACPERAAMPEFYAQTEALFDLLGQDEIWPLAYLRWEIALLDQMGYGLDLTQCAVTGARADLRYVSPKTGRAVSGAGAGEWAARLLPLSPALIGQSASDEDVAQGLDATGHFLAHHLHHGEELPIARGSFRDRVATRS